MAVLLLLQVPPVSPLLLNNVDDPIQIGEAPLTVPEFTLGLTVSVLNADTGLLHPVLIV